MNRMTIGELRDECDERGISFPINARKAELIALLQRHRRRAAFFTRNNSLLTLLGALVVLMASLYGSYEWFTACDRDCRAVKTILQPRGAVGTLTNAVPPYVERPHCEGLLKPAIGHADQAYFVVVGPRGCGKSRCVDTVVADRPGVLRVNLGGRFESHSAVYRAILKSLGENLVKEFADDSAEVLVALFRRVAREYRQMHRGEPDWVPTLVV